MRSSILALVMVAAATGCGLLDPPSVAIAPGAEVSWTLEVENHSNRAFSVYIIASDAQQEMSAFLVDPCGASLGSSDFEAPFSIHLGPAGPNGLVDLARPQIEALPLALDSNAVPGPANAPGYRFVIGEDGEVEAVTPLAGEPDAAPVAVC